MAQPEVDRFTLVVAISDQLRSLWFNRSSAPSAPSLSTDSGLVRAQARVRSIAKLKTG